METKTVNIKINNSDYQVPQGVTILDAAKRVGIDILLILFFIYIIM